MKRTLLPVFSETSLPSEVTVLTKYILMSVIERVRHCWKRMR